MTDEDLIELLRRIKQACKTHPSCHNCSFDNEIEIKSGYSCQIRALVKTFGKTAPSDWDMEEIERIIKL